MVYVYYERISRVFSNRTTCTTSESHYANLCGDDITQELCTFEPNKIVRLTPLLISSFTISPYTIPLILLLKVWILPLSTLNSGVGHSIF